jgi:protoporphyrinogen oxidase
MFVISFGLRGHDPHQYTAVYFPESSFWVNRISYPASFSAANAPLDHWSLQAEITCKKDGELWQKSDEDILAHTKAGLQARGLLPSDEAIVFARVDRVAEAYVVYDVGYEERVATVRAWFASQGISLLGRFGRFDYVNVDMAVERALQLAIALNADEGNYEQLKSDYLQSALSSLKRENMECV